MIPRTKLDCIVAGDANVDLLMDGVRSLAFGKELLAQDMNLMMGGSSAITAHNLARMGLRVGFTAVVGSDLFGDFVESFLSRAGLDLSYLRRSHREKTGLTIWHSFRGNRAGITYAGTIARLQATQVPLAYLQSARHLHVGAYFLLQEFHAGAALLFQKAHQAGLTTSLDCNYDPTERWDAGIWKVLPHTDIFFPNEDEALCLTGERTVREAAIRLNKYARIVVIKQGPKGALVCKKGSVQRVPAIKTHVVDTTGAGDSFNAGFLSKFIKGKSLPECARAGVAAGARSVAFAGGTKAFEPKR